MCNTLLHTAAHTAGHSRAHYCTLPHCRTLPHSCTLHAALPDSRTLVNASECIYMSKDEFIYDVVWFYVNLCGFVYILL
jgi:hypothetical protein